MERLTNHFSYCECAECKYYDEELAKCNKCKIFITSTGHCHDKKVWEKLRDYEDLEEKGLLLKLPCKVGDTIYLVKGKNHVEIEELEVMKFLYSNELDIMFSDEIYEVGLTSIKEIGKSVFITEEEAEKALERLEKENE